MQKAYSSTNSHIFPIKAVCIPSCLVVPQGCHVTSWWVSAWSEPEADSMWSERWTVWWSVWLRLGVWDVMHPESAPGSFPPALSPLLVSESWCSPGWSGSYRSSSGYCPEQSQPSWMSHPPYTTGPAGCSILSSSPHQILLFGRKNFF